EVFANLVAAYEGPPQVRSRKAFGSLMIIMGTTVVTMLIVGPAIHKISNPSLSDVSVFTQTMDALLPAPLPYLGTIISVLVLLSASAASAQGLQNLALGLRNRRYIPVVLGERNMHGVADKPVWLEVGLVAIIFLFAGTNEETYLALYAAGVFILLSMTGWAAAKRLVRELKEVFVRSQMAMLVGIVIAALLTSAATLVIFQERFFEGAWMYFVFIPLLYAGFTYSRNRMGAPLPEVERLGELDQAFLGGFGFGQSFEPVPVMATAFGSANPGYDETMSTRPKYTPPTETTPPRHILVPLDGSDFAEQSLPAARSLAEAYGGRITLTSVVPVQRLSEDTPIPQWQHEQVERSRAKLDAYLETVAVRLREADLTVDKEVLVGSVAEAINRLVDERDIDIVVYSTRGRGGIQRWLLGSVATRLIQLLTRPLLIIRPRVGSPPPIMDFKKILVTLDGSEFAERVLPFARASIPYGTEIILLTIPQIPEAHQYGAVVEEIQQLREYVEQRSQTYLEDVAESLSESGLETRVIVKGTRPAETIVQVAEEEDVDIIMLATHGRGGFDRLFVGSVADRVVQFA
ncbi:MAG: universal stress protein, partial [Anaerolineales bacterium]|nr:universal stress protein [Anaerolineales bacterium]